MSLPVPIKTINAQRDGGTFEILNALRYKKQQPSPVSGNADRLYKISEASSMKMFMIMYEYAIDAEVFAEIKKTSIVGYTKWSKVQGAGPETGPKLDTRFWPGLNDVLVVVVDEKDAVRVKEMVLHLRSKYPQTGVRCFIVPVEEMI